MCDQAGDEGVQGCSFDPTDGYRDVHFLISLFVVLCICVLSIFSDVFLIKKKKALEGMLGLMTLSTYFSAWDLKTSKFLSWIELCLPNVSMLCPTHPHPPDLRLWLYLEIVSF